MAGTGVFQLANHINGLIMKQDGMTRLSHGCRYRSHIKVVNRMGDAIIFMAGLGAGSIVTMFIMLVALISDYIREKEKDDSTL